MNIKVYRLDDKFTKHTNDGMFSRKSPPPIYTTYGVKSQDPGLHDASHASDSFRYTGHTTPL